MRYLKDLPFRDGFPAQPEGTPPVPLNVNAHFHTPYSYSSFSDMAQIFEMAKEENIRVLGINDFYVTDGYDEFAEAADKNKIFPLFNIEAIALWKEMQQKDIRVNDPGNPGRTYLSGKGLDYPVTLAGPCREMLESVKAESQRQMHEMIEKLNVCFRETGIDLTFTYGDIRKHFARQLVRERHIAKALRTALFEHFDNDDDRRMVLKKLYGKPTAVDIHQAAALENELRNNLLKAGKKAFVKEDEKAFLSVDQVKEIIAEAGGIPCYPVLLDDPAGDFTEFEADWEVLYKNLITKHISCIELIPGRNRYEILDIFVQYFHKKGFVILFGTEHNAPGLFPLTPNCRGGVPLTPFLRQVNYEIAAHQYLRARGDEGYTGTEGDGEEMICRRARFILLGDAVIRNRIE